MSDLFGADAYPLAAQVAEVERELRQRAHVYPRLVAAGRMTRDAAGRHTAAMEAALRTLRSLEGRADKADAPMRLPDALAAKLRRDALHGLAEAAARILGWQFGKEAARRLFHDPEPYLDDLAEARAALAHAQAFLAHAGGGSQQPDGKERPDA